MARKPRIHYPGAVYHVILRGNDGQDIFYFQKDRSYLYILIQEGIERFNYRVHAFCLMTNHIHLVVQVGDIPLAKIVQNLSFRYTRYVNKIKKRVGHLFQGRYKALLIDADTYLLELVRYMHNNPVRAALVEDPGQYQWSSHRAYINREKQSWLTKDFVLSQFAKNEIEACQLFHKFCLSGIKEKHRQEFHKGNFEGRILGDDGFSEKAIIKAKERIRFVVDLEQLVLAVCKAYRVEEKRIIDPGKQQPAAEARSVIAYLAQEIGNPSLTDLGRYLRRDITALSRSASRLRNRLRKDHDLTSQLNRLKSELQRKSECQA